MPQKIFVDDAFLARLPSSPIPGDSVNTSFVHRQWNFGFTAANSGFKWVEQGKEHYTINGKYHELIPGRILWVNAGDELIMANEKNTQGICINISPATLHNFLQEQEIVSNNLQLEGGIIPSVLLPNTDISELPAWENTFALLLELLDNLDASKNRLPHKSKNSLKMVSRQLQIAWQLLSNPQHFEKNLDYFAAACGMSPYHFTRCFTAFFGCSPKKHHAQIRLQHARQELQSGNNILPFYFQYGYSDYSAFSRAFKAQHGISPKNLARNAKLIAA
ncbi:MAG: helix-turn-helix domain-containing protein [Luteibaculum sp.]